MSSAQYLIPDKKKLANNPQMQNQVLYAPFVKASDKVKKDVADLSLSDFKPQRFALNYDPPMIILEYLVPSTGKLYHHKMKLRRLTGSSTVAECVKYLQKRHPLYFLNHTIRQDQIVDLIERLIYRVKQSEELRASTTKQSADKEPEKPRGTTQNKKPSFKTGSSLPAIEDDDEGALGAGAGGFPGLSGQVGSLKENQNLTNKAKQMFDDLDFDDDFSDNDAKGKKQENAAADLAFGQESESGEFDANELLNFSDYKNKRQQAVQDPFSKQQTNLSIKDVLNDQKKNELNNEEEDDWGGSDDWDTSAPQKDVDLSKVDLRNTNLNKLSDNDLAAHKRAMDKDFNMNQLKPGDAGFVYDKVVDFSKDPGVGGYDLDDDSWGEDDGIDEEKQDEDAEYYDEEDEDEAANAALAGAMKNRQSNIGSNEDNDYFDDDFDDDFA